MLVAAGWAAEGEGTIRKRSARVPIKATSIAFVPVSVLVKTHLSANFPAYQNRAPQPMFAGAPYPGTSSAKEDFHNTKLNVKIQQIMKSM